MTSDTPTSYSDLVTKANLIQAWNDGAMYALDIINNSSDLSEAREKILKCAKKLQMNRYGTVFERMGRHMF